MCRYDWHSAGSLGSSFPMLKYKYIFQIKYTEAILSTSTWKLLWFEITKTLIVVKKIYCVIYYNFRHTFVPYWTGQFGQRFIYCGMVESTRCTTTQSLLGTLYTVCHTVRSVSGKAAERGHATANAKSRSAVCRRPARP